jgi:hypothetical protein
MWIDEAMVVVPPRTKHMTVIRRALAEGEVNVPEEGLDVRLLDAETAEPIRVLPPPRSRGRGSYGCESWGSRLRRRPSLAAPTTTRCRGMERRTLAPRLEHYRQLEAAEAAGHQRAALAHATERSEDPGRQGSGRR